LVLADLPLSVAAHGRPKALQNQSMRAATQ
jgi:hypothetical protein